MLTSLTLTPIHQYRSFAAEAQCSDLQTRSRIEYLSTSDSVIVLIVIETVIKHCPKFVLRVSYPKLL